MGGPGASSYLEAGGHDTRERILLSMSDVEWNKWVCVMPVQRRVQRERTPHSHRPLSSDVTATRGTPFAPRLCMQPVVCACSAQWCQGAWVGAGRLDVAVRSG